MKQATAILQELTTDQLIEAFEATEENNDEDIATVRGWIMDELESRDQVAFNAWIDAVPVVSSPRSFFVGK